MRHIETISPCMLSELELRQWHKRTAVRVVIVDGGGNVALLWVGRYGYYMLPGGGISEKDASLEAAFYRECREETGASIEITGEIGYVVECRIKDRLHQTSFGYVARAVAMGTPCLTKRELDDKIVTRWVSQNDALNLLGQNKATNYAAPFIRVRDHAFMQNALVLLNQG